jgi:hypothetical protein
LLFATTSFAQTRHPNTEKYRDSSVSNASGRAGSASIEARALATRDGSSTIEITTGSFDSDAAATGTIAKVQLKAAGVPEQPTRNFNGLGDSATFTATLDPLGRHEHLQIQASVRDVDGARTDVVSAEEIVKLRPDLVVAGLSVRPRVPIGIPTNLHATISETNGDLGARADAHLLVGGVEVDSAEGIWVDAGDTVDVNFAYAFETAGDATVQVVVDSVRPGDWDEGNNSASATLHVFTEAEAFLSANVSVRDEDTTEYHYSKTPYSELLREGGGFTQSVRFDGFIPRNVDFNTVHVSARITTDGAVMYDYPDIAFGPGINRVNRFMCSEAINGPGAGTMCYQLPGRFWRNPFTSVELELGGGEITYHSRGYNMQMAPERPGDPYYIFDYVQSSSYPYTRLGSTVSFDIFVSDALDLWRSTPVIDSIADGEEHVNQPYACQYSSFYGGLTCMETRRDTHFRSGAGSQ